MSVRVGCGIATARGEPVVFQLRSRTAARDQNEREGHGGDGNEAKMRAHTVLWHGVQQRDHQAAHGCSGTLGAERKLHQRLRPAAVRARPERQLAAVGLGDLAREREADA